MHTTSVYETKRPLHKLGVAVSLLFTSHFFSSASPPSVPKNTGCPLIGSFSTNPTTRRSSLSFWSNRLTRTFHLHEIDQFHWNPRLTAIYKLPIYNNLREGIAPSILLSAPRNPFRNTKMQISPGEGTVLQCRQHRNPVHLFTLRSAFSVLHFTLRMILTAAKRITATTMSLSTTSTTTKSTIFASGAWNG